MLTIFAKIFIIRTLLLSSTAWPRVLRDKCKLGIPSPGYTSTEVKRQVRRFPLLLSLCLYSSIFFTSRSRDFCITPTTLHFLSVKMFGIRAVDRKCRQPFKQCESDVITRRGAVESARGQYVGRLQCSATAPCLILYSWLGFKCCRGDTQSTWLNPRWNANGKPTREASSLGVRWGGSKVSKNRQDNYTAIVIIFVGEIFKNGSLGLFEVDPKKLGFFGQSLQWFLSTEWEELVFWPNLPCKRN